jgi:transposase
LPDALWLRARAAHPAASAETEGRAALTGILFVLKTCIPWAYLPAEMGCVSGMTCWRRLRDCC